MLKSPLNYIGGKYKLLAQLLPLFPENINTFVDLFAGGLDVSLNVNAEKVICNDINNYVIGLYQYFQQNSIEDLLLNIQHTISKYGLSKDDKDSYNRMRDDYNKNHSPLLLFMLICYGFNHQIRFNSKGQFNNPAGYQRSSYNSNIENNLIQMHEKITDFTFTVGNFRKFDLSVLNLGDFLYADPPYLISCGSYNDGKRGFEGWSAIDDTILFRKLDELNERGVKFALSNVTVHKGKKNFPLINWSKKYTVHYLNADYSNSNYQASANETVEVVVTNY